MALQKLLANLEQGTTAGVVDSYPNHAQFNNGNGLGWVSGNSTSIFDTSVPLVSAIFILLDKLHKNELIEKYHYKRY